MSKLRRWEFNNRCHTKEEKFFLAFALDYLSLFGNTSPTKAQVRAMVDLLSFVFARRGLAIDSRLSKREKLCLQLSAQGKGVRETAEFLGLCTRQVDRFRQQIKQKLHCNKLSQAVALSIRHDLPR